jgi:hypothetical protein
MLRLFAWLSVVGIVHGAIYNDISDVINIEFDFVVIGGELLPLSLISLMNVGIGGTAGSVVANRLSENPEFQVLVVEDGSL